MTDVKLADFRQLDDFILDAARFQIPPYRDLDKWCNRIIANLLHYQTNYFLMIMMVFLVVGLIHPRDMLLGFLAVAGAFAVFVYATSRTEEAVRFKKDHPIVSLFVIAVGGWLIVRMFGSVIVFLFGMALPMLLMFMHASTRLRSLSNKIQTKLEGLGFRKTPMGAILESIGIELDSVVFN